MAFRSAVKSVNPVAIPFDPVTLRAGTPVVLDASNNIRIPSDVSPDGRQLALFSIGERQEDAFIGGVDGKGIRRVTDDAARDRGPMFTRDGKSLVFYSNRDGRWEPWSVRADGGNLRKIAAIEGCIFVLVSTVDDTVVCSTTSGTGELFAMPLNGDPAAPTKKLANTRIPEGSLNPTAFSPDGTRLAGLIQAPTGRTVGVAVYDLRAHALTMVSADDNSAVRWLPDNRRLIYFTTGGSQLVVVDTVTRQRTIVEVRLPAPSIDDLFSIARDGRMIYYGAARAEADIWIAERKK
jgi:Tol biopolymer transport system component